MILFRIFKHFVFCCLICFVSSADDIPIINPTTDYHYIDTRFGLGRRFDGVGAISGGGATSKLLVNYPEPQRSNILDFLYKPNFGASLQILKVEIGGDAQSSEGTESSHMHEEWDENYQRGYEWWMMTEAKKRNPAIQLCGLSWGYPGWLGNGSWSPYVLPNKTANYIYRWIAGAKKYYNLSIDCIGLWNEKPYEGYYIKILRKTLNANGFSNVKIVAADGMSSSGWSIVDDMKKDPELKAAVDIVGVHYEGSYSPQSAKDCGKPIWSSEDWSDGYNEDGGGCMGRLLNQNYVVGKMTSLIAWNLIDSFYPDIMYSGAGMMLANEPWSGYYVIGPAIWAAAHTTQFTKIGWTYLKDQYGTGVLKYGGSFVSLMSPDGSEYTLVIETMDTSTGQYCLRPPARPTKVVDQTIVFMLKGPLAKFSKFHYWKSHLHGDNTSMFFKYHGIYEAIKGNMSLFIQPNTILTLTTVSTGMKGDPGTIPPSKPFPLPYSDDFNIYPEYQEAYNFASQTGAFEIRQTNDAAHGKVLRQVVLQAPIHWCPILQTTPIGIIGNFNWSDIDISVDVFVPRINATDGVFVGARVNQGGCTMFLGGGVYFFLLFQDQSFVISSDLERTNVIYTGSVTLQPERWYRMELAVKANQVTAQVDGHNVCQGTIGPKVSTNGFVSFGTSIFGVADFDNLLIKST